MSAHVEAWALLHGTVDASVAVAPSVLQPLVRAFAQAVDRRDWSSSDVALGAQAIDQ
jgi:hypothetical protein